MTKDDIAVIKHMLQRKAARGNMKAAEMLMKVYDWQRDLDDAVDKKHELEVIMGSPTDGLMKRIRPGQISLSKPEIEEKKQA